MCTDAVHRFFVQKCVPMVMVRAWLGGERRYSFISECTCCCLQWPFFFVDPLVLVVLLQVCFSGTMEGRVENLEERVGDDEVERIENGDERRFKVGELVEFWDGPQIVGRRHG